MLLSEGLLMILGVSSDAATPATSGIASSYELEIDSQQHIILLQ